MSKTIQFTYNDVDYTLEYTRKTLEKMEADGIVLADMNKKPVTILPKLLNMHSMLIINTLKKRKLKKSSTYLQTKMICITSYLKWQQIH